MESNLDPAEMHRRKKFFIFNMAANSRSSIRLFALIGAGLFILAAVALLALRGYFSQTPAPSPAPVELLTAGIETVPPDFDYKLQDPPYRCPLNISFCTQRVNFKEGSFSATLRQDTPLLAAFNGQIETASTSKRMSNGQFEEFNTVILHNKTRAMRAFYHFKGRITDKKTVSEGERIATASAVRLASYENASFVLEMLKVGTESGKLVNFKIGDFR